MKPRWYTHPGIAAASVHDAHKIKIRSDVPVTPNLMETELGYAPTPTQQGNVTTNKEFKWRRYNSKT